MRGTLKKNFVLLGILMVVALAGAGFTVLTGGGNPVTVEKDKFQIVTSFYPVYIAALNVADGLEDVEVTNMTENVGGCLHDYQLTAADMKKLEHADVFLINGAGMESFMESVLETYPDLTVIDTSEGIELLEAVEHDHTHVHEEEHEEIHEEEKDNHGMQNGHIWMNPDNYTLQITNMMNGLSLTDKEHKADYEKNAHVYMEKVQAVGAELEKIGLSKEEEPIVIFHDSYLADKLKFHIVYEVVMEEDTSLSAGEIAEIMEEIRLHEVSVLLAEKQFSNQIPMRIAEETGTQVMVVDSLVSGEVDKDAWLNGMSENIHVLKEVFQIE